MDSYQTALLIGAIVAALLNYNQPRAIRWITLGAADCVLTTLYYYVATDWAPHPFVTGVADATLAIAIAIFGIHMWERLVRYAFIVSIGISGCYLLGYISDRTTYATSLEVANWFALLFIGGAGIMRIADERLVGPRAWTSSGGGIHYIRWFFDGERRPKGVFAKAAERLTSN